MVVVLGDEAVRLRRRSFQLVLGFRPLAHLGAPSLKLLLDLGFMVRGELLVLAAVPAAARDVVVNV